jgi:O-antigen/teichoic acid export membrane protein
VIPFLRCFNLFLSKQVLIAYDKEKLYVKSLVVSGVIFICATLVLSYLYKDVGASIAMVAYEGSLLALNYYYTRTTDPVLKVFDWTSALHALLGSALFIPMIIAFRRWMEADALFLFISIASCCVIYVLFQLFVLRNEFMLSLRSWSIQRLGLFQKRNK